MDYQDLLHQADARSLRFCLPDNTKVSDLRRLAVDELLRQEGELRKLAASLLLPLFVRQFPCRPYNDRRITDSSSCRNTTT